MIGKFDYFIFFSYYYFVISVLFIVEFFRSPLYAYYAYIYSRPLRLTIDRLRPNLARVITSSSLLQHSAELQTCERPYKTVEAVPGRPFRANYRVRLKLQVLITGSLKSGLVKTGPVGPVPPSLTVVSVRPNVAQAVRQCLGSLLQIRCFITQRSETLVGPWPEWPPER